MVLKIGDVCTVLSVKKAFKRYTGYYEVRDKVVEV